MSENEIIAWLQKVLAGETPALPASNDQLITDTLQLADWHGVTALIHYKLSEKLNLKEYHAGLNKQLSDKNLQSIAISLLWKQEICKINQFLIDAKINLLFIKGFPLAYTLYPAPHLRIFSDVDILLPDFETTQKAWHILEDMGYIRPKTIGGKYISHQFSCYRPDTSLLPRALDLHWRINNHYYFANALTFDELESSSVPLTGFEPEMRTLSPEYALLFSCMHRIAHTPFGESNRLIWLYDIHLLAGSFNQEQWSCFTGLATEKKLSNVCLDGLLKSRDGFKTRLPENILEILRRQGKNDPVQVDDFTSAWKYHMKNYQTMPGWKERFCLLREYLLPPSEYMLAKYNRRNKLWLPVLHVMRLSGGLTKIFKNRS